MSLKIEHINPYLLHGLKCVCKEVAIMELTRIDTLSEKYQYWFQTKNDPMNKDFNYEILLKDSCIERGFNQSDIKPILRPMSDIVNPCLEGGAIPVEEIAKLGIDYDEKLGDYGFSAKYHLNRQMRIDTTWHHTSLKEPLSCDNLFIQTVRTHLNPYWVNEYLFKHLFDVFHLIEQNLAVDVNSSANLNVLFTDGEYKGQTLNCHPELENHLLQFKRRDH